MADAASPARTRVAIFISGRGSNMAALLYAAALPDAAYEVVLVAANDPQAEGLALAEAESIPTFALSHKGMSRADHDAAMDEAARKAGAELIVLAGYMRILTESFARQWQGRMLNIHPALLPRHGGPGMYGLRPHESVLAAGDEESGATVHVVTEEYDQGPILRQRRVPVCIDDTPEDLQRRVLVEEHVIYSEVLRDIVEGTIELPVLEA